MPLLISHIIMIVVEKLQLCFSSLSSFVYAQLRSHIPKECDWIIATLSFSSTLLEVCCCAWDCIALCYQVSAKLQQSDRQSHIWLWNTLVCRGVHGWLKLTARGPGPVAIKQAQIISAPPLCLVGLRSVCAAVLYLSFHQMCRCSLWPKALCSCLPKGYCSRNLGIF